MDSNSLRLALRAHTSERHNRLDAAVGTFGSPYDYGEFVASSLQFRRLVEPAIVSVPGDWQLAPLVGALRQDADDLRIALPPPRASVLGLSSEAERLGALYVLEGSALGAQLLLKRAQELGFHEGYGARHLACQIAEEGRWRRFVMLLDTRTDLDRDAVLAGAMTVFDAALAVYSGAVPA